MVKGLNDKINQKDQELNTFKTEIEKLNERLN